MKKGTPASSIGQGASGSSARCPRASASTGVVERRKTSPGPDPTSPETLRLFATFRSCCSSLQIERATGNANLGVKPGVCSPSAARVVVRPRFSAGGRASGRSSDRNAERYEARPSIGPNQTSREIPGPFARSQTHQNVDLGRARSIGSNRRASRVLTEIMKLWNAESVSQAIFARTRQDL